MYRRTVCKSNKNSANIAEVLFKLGYTVKGNSWGYSQVKQRMTDLNLSSANFKGKMLTMKLIKKEKYLQINYLE